MQKKLTGKLFNNSESTGLDTRDLAKRFLYAQIYGAGVAKLGEIVNGFPEKELS